MAQNDYERGQIDARLDINDERHKQNIERFDKLESSIKELVEAVSIAKGGLRLLFAVGTISAGMGALAQVIIEWFKK